MTDEANAFLMGSGGRSASFETVNDQVWGVVMGMEMRQQTKFQTGELLFWNDGKPRMQLVVTLLTDDHDDDDDDGLRKVYVRGQMQQAVSGAVVKAGARGLAEGGRLFIRFVSVDEPKSRGVNGAKRYFAKYDPPIVGVPTDESPALEPDDMPF